VNKKVLILGLGGLLLLGGGGGALYATGMLGGGHDGKQEEAKPAEPEKAGSGVFVQLEPLMAPVIVDGKIKMQVSVTLSLEVKDSDSRNEVARLLPRLRDAMLQDLYGTPVVGGDGEGAIDLPSLKSRMLAVARQLLGADRVQQVLVTKAMRIG